MQPIDPLGLSANDWRFLSAPERYVEASRELDRPLVLESTRRQFLTVSDILARLCGTQGVKARRGVLLADDVGLGKTTVAALVAWVVASTGRVRILAPNRVMLRRWEEELLAHVKPLQRCAPALRVQRERVKPRKVVRLAVGSIQVATHFDTKDSPLDCDLLIVDEAHRAKGEGTEFRRALRRKLKFASRVLILTATPFSVELNELNGLLEFVGGYASHAPVRSFSRALDKLHDGRTIGDPGAFAKRLVEKARDAVESLGPFVIRHGLDDIPREQRSFGTCEHWLINVPSATPEVIELIARMDRALRLSDGDGSWSSRITNDPRFHVGWEHFDAERERLKAPAAEPARAVVHNHLRSMARLRKGNKVHPKMEAVAEAVKSVVEQGEKVVLFCDHHATARELTVHLDQVILEPKPAPWPECVWRNAWHQVPEPKRHEFDTDILRRTFIEWLVSPLIRAQTWSWLPASTSTSEAGLADALRTRAARHARNSETIVAGAWRLYHALLDSKSSRAVLRQTPENLPGAEGTSRVVGVCEPSEEEKERPLFLHSRQPDTVLSIFNSPFGPDVLVVTDRLSEGIDLHRYCRHLVHYELDPSPIRTVQRNGRLRRVNSWAAATGQPILYAYPAFGGTRDHRFVQIMRKRIDSFSLLLGGVRGIEVEEIGDAEEQWRNEVIAAAKSGLAENGKRLRARKPGRT